MATRDRQMPQIVIHKPNSLAQKICRSTCMHTCRMSWLLPIARFMKESRSSVVASQQGCSTGLRTCRWHKHCRSHAGTTSAGTTGQLSPAGIFSWFRKYFKFNLPVMSYGELLLFLSFLLLSTVVLAARMVLSAVSSVHSICKRLQYMKHS